MFQKPSFSVVDSVLPCVNEDSCGNTGNFLAALQMIANHKIIEIIEQDIILNNLLEEIKAAKLYSEMVDEVTSHNKEQLKKVKCDHRSKFSNLSNWKEEA